MTSPISEKYGTYYKLIGILVDLVLINLCGYLAYLFVFYSSDAHEIEYLRIGQILLINFIWFNATQITRLYNDIFSKDAIPTIKQSLASLLLLTLFMCCLILLLPEFKSCYIWMGYTLLIFLPMLLWSKIVFLLYRRKHRVRLIRYTRVVIVGAGPVGLELSRIMQDSMSLGYRVVGFFDDKVTENTEEAYIIGKVEDCIRYVKAHHIKEIYCALPDRAIDKINKLMRQADKEMIRFKLVPDVRDYFKKNVNVSLLGHFPVITPRTEPLQKTANMMFKRTFDYVFSALVVVFVISWLYPIIALLIKLESKGPVLFRQLRSGKDNKPFYCLKFRSMYVNGDSDKLQAVRNDCRITKIGAFLRKTSLDELPQFFNVLAGSMSVVGPRPHMLQHTKEYSAMIDQFMVRHFLMPGITGWAQVKGLRGGTNEEGTMEERVKADIWYMENWSLFLDLKIVFLTVWQVIAGHEKAY